MNEAIVQLCALQEVDVQIAEARSELAALDDGAKARARSVAAKALLAEKTNTMQDLERRIREGELELKSIESRIKALEQKAYSGTVTNPKELSGMEQQIAALGRSKGNLEDKILPLYDAAEEARTAVAQAQQIAAEAERKADAVKAAYERRSAELTERIAQLEPRRRTMAEGVDAALLKRYEAIRARTDNRAVVPVVEGRCGGCQMALTAFELRTLEDRAQLHNCETCGRFLYMED